MTLFPRQKVNGNREQSISRGFGSFLRPAIHMESVLDPRLVAKPRSIVLVLGWEPLQCQEESWGPGAEQLTPPREPDNSFQVTAGPGKRTRQLSHSCVYWWPCSSGLPGCIMSTHPGLKVPVAHLILLRGSLGPFCSIFFFWGARD